MVSKWWHCSVLYRILIHVHVRFLSNCTQYATKYAPALKMFTKSIISLSHIVCRLVIVSHCEYWEYLSLESKEKWKIDQLWHYLTFFFFTYCILKWMEWRTEKKTWDRLFIWLTATYKPSWSYVATLLQ